MQDSGFRLSGSRLKNHVRVEDSLISIQAPEESNASRHFRQWPNAKFQTKYGFAVLLYIQTAKKVTGQKLYLRNSHGRNMHANPCMLYDVFILAVLRQCFISLY